MSARPWSTATPALTEGEVYARMRRFGVLDIAIEVASLHRVNFAETFAKKSRRAEYSRARRHFLARVRIERHVSYPKIARILELDHTTVITAVRLWLEENANGKATQAQG